MSPKLNISAFKGLYYVFYYPDLQLFHNSGAK